MTNALDSLYGPGHVNATRTRECVAMPGTRNQVILTPQCIVDALRHLWSEGIEFDPAHAEGSLLGARRWTDAYGLCTYWPDRTYCNPPYGASLFDASPKYRELLKAEQEIRADAKRLEVPIVWPEGLPLKKAGLQHWLKQQIEHSGESVLLAPNRTHRKWFRAWRAKCDALVELNPITFVGFDQAFPAPLVLGYVGDRIDAFYAAFAGLGDPA